MKLAVALALVGLAVAGCGSATQAPVTLVYGEVHLHQYASGTHPAALFVAQPVPVAEVQGDSVLPLVDLPSQTDGPCTLVLPSGCPPPCSPGANFVDAGAVHLRGAEGGQLDLTYHASLFSYQPVQTLAPGSILFHGGEEVTVSGDGAAAPEFHGTIHGAQPLTIDAPASLPVAKGAPFAIAWEPGQAERIRLSLLASTRDGSFATLTCIVPDAPGGFTLPDGLLAGLPPPPRDLSLEVSRDELGFASASQGRGVILHSGFALTIAGHEDP